LIKAAKVKLTDAWLGQIAENIIRHHPFLKDHMFNNKGKCLFMMDADIAREITHTFLQNNKVVLPIHDGFIAAKEDRDFLEETMQSVWKNKFGTSITIKEE